MVRDVPAPPLASASHISASRCYDVQMRTTINLPDDLYELAKNLARDRSQTMSDALARLIRRGLDDDRPREIYLDPLTGFPVMRSGRPITTEDVRSLEDEE